MSRGMRIRWALAVLAWGLASACATVEEPAPRPRNVILMIGDGMGLEHMKAASLFQHGREGALFMESLPRSARVITCSAYTVPSDRASAAKPKVTDSAAASTAMATGRKVYNGVLGVALPGDGRPLRTILEDCAAAGKRTGLITSSFLTDATPSGFGAHVKARTLQNEIAEQYLRRSRPNLLLGGANKEKNTPLTPAGGKAAGYAVATNRTELTACLADTNATHVLGLFGAGPMRYEYDYLRGVREDYDRLPHLSEMAAAALSFLDREPRGFFAMIEGACIDKAAHKNDLERAVHDVLEFDRAVRLVVEWALRRGDTLVLVTADHETGGLRVVRGAGKGKMPRVKWSTKSHTGADVALFAAGPGSEGVAGHLDNTDIHRLLSGAFTTPSRYVPPAAVPGEAGRDEIDDND